MSKIEQLTKLKNKILDKLLTTHSVEKTKEHYRNKGFYFGVFLKYLFLKPVKIKSDINKEAHFFVSKNGTNEVKSLFLNYSMFVFGTSLFGFLFNIDVAIGLFTLTSIMALVVFSIFYIFMCPLIWIVDNYETKKKFNTKNLEKIKNSLFKNYNKDEIKSLIQQKLDKKELEDILVILNEVIGEDELFEIFKKLDFAKGGKEISEPYVLLSIIEEAIKKKKEKNDDQYEIDILKENKKIFKLAIDKKDIVIDEKQLERNHYKVKQ